MTVRGAAVRDLKIAPTRLVLCSGWVTPPTGGVGASFASAATTLAGWITPPTGGVGAVIDRER